MEILFLTKFSPKNKKKDWENVGTTISHKIYLGSYEMRAFQENLKTECFPRLVPGGI